MRHYIELPFGTSVHRDVNGAIILKVGIVATDAGVFRMTVTRGDAVHDGGKL